MIFLPVEARFVDFGGFALGHVAKAPFHMVTKSSLQEAANELSLLKSHDFAFIKCTTEVWTYTLLDCWFVDESKENACCFSWIPVVQQK
jgi:hypothetical protein